MADADKAGERRNLIANTEDSNVDIPKELMDNSDDTEEVLKEKEFNRWLVIGSKLADEAADVFEAVLPEVNIIFDKYGNFIGPTPSQKELETLGKIFMTERELDSLDKAKKAREKFTKGGRASVTSKDLGALPEAENLKFKQADYEELIMETIVRASDMRIRSLQIGLQRSDLTAGEKQLTKQQIFQLHAKITAQSENYFNKFESDKGDWAESKKLSAGHAFEYFGLCRERLKLLSAGNYDHFVRLATIREDKIHESIEGIILNGTKIKISKDVVISDIDGTPVKELQMKNKTDRNDKKSNTTSNNGNMVPKEFYPDKEKRNRDSYPELVSTS